MYSYRYDIDLIRIPMLSSTSQPNLRENIVSVKISLAKGESMARP